GIIFFATGILSAISSLLAVRIARRIGLVRTMVFTHIPASVLLIVMVFMPNVWLAMTCFILRGLLSQMDVPVRISYVMAVVTPPERPAAASITNVPRSLASALPPIAAGWMLDHSTFGWPLLICATLKITYDLILLVQFRHIRPPEEMPR
ncbi:MAG: MFS transporter, partial [Actinomycetota bacterium]